MKQKVLPSAVALILFRLSALAQDSTPDLSRSALAGRQDYGAWAQLVPALLFFVGLGLIAGLFLLGEASRRRRQTPRAGEPPNFPRRFPRPPFPPPPGTKR